MNDGEGQTSTPNQEAAHTTLEEQPVSGLSRSQCLKLVESMRALRRIAEKDAKRTGIFDLRTENTESIISVTEGQGESHPATQRDDSNLFTSELAADELENSGLHDTGQTPHQPRDPKPDYQKLKGVLVRLEDWLRLLIPFKRHFMIKLKERVADKQKIFISKIFHLLSKKYGQRVDENFINEQIRYYVIKERIADPGLLSYINDAERINVSTEEFKKGSNANQLEKSLKLYLSFELFYPLDVIFSKYAQLYYRNFLRYVRLHIEAKDCLKAVDCLARACTLIEREFSNKKREIFGALKLPRKAGAERFLHNVHLVVKNKELKLKYALFKAIGAKDGGRLLSHLLKLKYENNMRRCLFDVLRVCLVDRLYIEAGGRSREFGTTESKVAINKFELLSTNKLSYGTRVGIIQDQRCGEGIGMFMGEYGPQNETLEPPNHNVELLMTEKTPMLNKKNVHLSLELGDSNLGSGSMNRVTSCTTIVDRRHSPRRKIPAVLRNGIRQIDHIMRKPLALAFNKMRTYYESMTLIEMMRTPNSDDSSGQRNSLVNNQTSLQSLGRRYLASRSQVSNTEEPPHNNATAVKPHADRTIGDARKKPVPIVFEVIGVEDKTHMLEPKTIVPSMSSRSIITSKQPLKKPSYEVPLINESSNFSAIEQLNRYQNVLQNTLRKVSTISDLQAFRRPSGQCAEYQSQRNSRFKTSAVIKRSLFTPKPSPILIDKTRNTSKSISSLFNPNFDKH